MIIDLTVGYTNRKVTIYKAINCYIF